MNKFTQRLLLATLSTGVALAIAYLVLTRGAPEDGTQLEDNREDVRALLESRRSPQARPTQPGDVLVREPISEEIALQLFGAIRGERVIYDPQCYFWETPNYSGSVRFPEHPSGAWPIRTNAQGFRKDTDASTTQPDLRILVTGDSHTAGRVPNDEQFANRLEQQLSELAPDRRIEALNAGKGAYSFYNYLGVLEKFLPLKPDLFVMAVYGGNDFGGPVNQFRYFNKLESPAPPDPEIERTWNEVWKDHKSLVTQDMNQVLAFSQRPEEVELAETLARQATLAIRDLCAREGIRLLVVYIPTCSQVQPQLIQERVNDLATRMGLTAADLARPAEVANRYLEFLKEESIACVDLRPTYSASSQPCYWVSDLHINTLGHQLLADELTRELSWMVTDAPLPEDSGRKDSDQ